MLRTVLCYLNVVEMIVRIIVRSHAVLRSISIVFGGRSLVAAAADEEYRERHEQYAKDDAEADPKRKRENLALR
eukprot:scaffold65533_cov21-Tisochrysis_lutea.AAC.1